MFNGGVGRYSICLRQGGALLVLTGFVLSPWLLPLAHGASIDELRRQQEQAAQKAQQYKEQAEQKAEQADDLTTTVKKINNEVSRLQKKITDTESQVKTTETAIQDTEGQIKSKEDELIVSQNKQIEAIQTMYLLGRESTLEALVSSQSLSEVIARDQYVAALEAKIESMMKEIRRLKSELEQKRNDLQNHRQQLKDFNTQLGVQKQGLQDQQATQQRLLTNAKQEMQRLSDLAAEQSRIETQVEAQIQAELTRLRNMNRAIRGTGIKVKKGDIIGYEGSTGNSTGPHVHFEVIVADTIERVNPRRYVPNPFSWPLDSFQVTQEFGKATCTICGYSWHTGIDITESYGAPVRAAADGEIILDQYYGGYGNAVIIDHNNGLWTLYGHMTGR